MIGALGGQSSSEIGATAPPEGFAVAGGVADAVEPGEALAEELAVAVHPGVPSPIPLPRSASSHCWASVSPQMPIPEALALDCAAANLPSWVVLGGPAGCWAPS